MNSVNKSISLGIIYFIGFGYHPVLKIKSPPLWDNIKLNHHPCGTTPVSTITLKLG
jgi:hypothetical protein